jgi:hypothetical protein
VSESVWWLTGQDRPLNELQARELTRLQLSAGYWADPLWGEITEIGAYLAHPHRNPGVPVSCGPARINWRLEGNKLQVECTYRRQMVGRRLCLSLPPVAHRHPHRRGFVMPPGTPIELTISEVPAAELSQPTQRLRYIDPLERAVSEVEMLRSRLNRAINVATDSAYNGSNKIKTLEPL